MRSSRWPIETRLAYIDEQLARKAFDPKTGEELSLIPTHLRSALQVERDSLIEERDVVHRTRALVAQRDAQSADRARVLHENDAAIADFANGDPRRAAALNDAMLRKEAEVMAEWILRRRYQV